MNRLTNMVDAHATNAFTWTDGDQLASEIGPWASSTVSYAYHDRLRNQLRLQQPTAPFLDWVQGYFYDEFGRLSNLISPTESFGYQYEPRWSSSGATASDLVRQLSLRHTGGFSARSYDDLGRLLSSALVGPLGDVPDYHGYGYDLGSQRTQQVFTAANYVNYSYDKIGQLLGAKGYEADQTPRPQERFGYGYDAAWNLNWRTNHALVLSFGVNNLNELTNVSRTPGSTLTVAGGTSLQATNVTVNGEPAQIYSDNTFVRETNNLADGTNTFVAWATNAQGSNASASVSVNLPLSVTYTYDLRGNLVSDGRRSFDYDDENQLKRVTVTNAWKSEFEHDGFLRRRVRREYAWSGGTWVKTNEVRYIYDGRLVIQERDSDNVPRVTYTRGLDLGGALEEAGGIGGLLARTDNQRALAGDASAFAFYHYDGNGNVTCMVDRGGNVVARYAYDPFGNILAMSGTLAEANLYRFSSKEYHPNSGLVYYLYRYYEPNLQRWLNRDTIEEGGGINLYSFVFNSPSDLIDGDGRCVPIIFVAIGLYFAMESYANAPRNTHEANDPGYSKWNSTDSPLSMVGQFPVKNLAPNLVKTMARDQIKKGVIYRVPGKDTPSGKPYIGRTTNPRGPPGRGKADGRDRTNAKTVRNYNTTQEGRIKEQGKMDASAGLSSLDNK